MREYFGAHNHTMYSNIRLIDCINKPKDLINKAIELGLSGIAITDHEALCSHMEINQYAKKIHEKNPNFVIALGNEIYLTDDRSSGQKYYHFIITAKNKRGYRALKELSSIAWYNMYSDRGMERVPTLKSELKEVMKNYKGDVIAQTACIGGELSQLILEMEHAREINDKENANTSYLKIREFIDFCIDVFGKDDFFIECAPANNPDQIKVNKKLIQIAKVYGLRMIFATDAHYLRPEDRSVHKAFLNSKDGEREVDEFYQYSYLMNSDEVEELLSYSFEKKDIDWLFENTLYLQNKIENYSLEKHQDIPEVKVKDYPKVNKKEEYAVLSSLYNSDNIQERYWINQCEEALIQKGLDKDKRYWDRLEEEATTKRIVGEKLQTCMFSYPNTLQHYIDLFWRCGSTVGAGRGSACSGLNHYLLGITQLDPIKWNLPFWRYLNPERVELGDIDLDLAPSRLQTIFEEIRKERGELGLVQVCTFGTEGTKSAIQTACRGYRSVDYPDGIDVDEAQYLSSLIPVERGFQWSINDVINGDAEKGRMPVTQFINEIEQYPGLLDIVKGIEGLVSRRGSHASGVILFDENIYDDAAIMRTPSGAIVTQWDLHMQEAAGSVKYDFLLTSVQDIIIETINLLQKDGKIEKDLTLREIYNKYLHPEVLPQDDNKMWDALANGTVINCFQFDSAVGSQAAKKIRPHNPMEMADANGLMRLMAAEKGAETPLDKYVRFKNNINLWYQEMKKWGLTEEEMKTVEPYFKSSYGVPPSQEQLMMMLMDENICGFNLKEANAARKIVGKKQMDKIPELHQKVLDQAKSKALGKYIWAQGVGPQMGYSFSIIHALAYSFVGMQTLYLATHFNPIYWNTACLIVDSGSLEESSDSTNYRKIAIAIGKMRKAGINISLVDINKSGFGFEPDAENNRVLFGLKAVMGVGDEVTNKIIENRPYSSVNDFIEKVNPNRAAMVALIKGGAFDVLEPDRIKCMKDYIWETCDKKKRLTMQNLAALMKYQLFPKNKYKQEKRVYEFTRYLKAMCKLNKETYKLDDRCIKFLTEIESDDLIEQDDKGQFILKAKDWDKVYQFNMDSFKDYINSHKDELLNKLNEIIFNEDMDKYAKGNISSWEMETLCFYYHEHELAKVNLDKYGLVDFFDLDTEPEVERTYTTKTGHKGNIFKLSKIAGTCIAKDKMRSTVSLLTVNGVVDVKFRKEYFSLFDKQISERMPDGTKHVVEKSWFNRGQMIIVQGFRSEDNFIPRKYGSQGHQLYRITNIDKDNNLMIQTERYNGGFDEEN